MTTANELKIGNYVIDSEVKMITKVTSISHNGELRLFCQGSSVGANNEEIEPIPLTEDILLKCGYGKTEFDNEFCDNVTFKNEVIIYNTTEKMLFINTKNDYIQLNHVHYLHQLQNLIFALTQQELNIQL